jgi:endoglucanase Acf2
MIKILKYRVYMYNKKWINEYKIISNCADQWIIIHEHLHGLIGQSVEYIVYHTMGPGLGFDISLHIMDVLQKHFLRPLQHYTLKSQNNIAWILIILRSKSNCIRVDTCTCT